jgi:hypothetical protein
MARKKNEERLFEIVHFSIHDVGRAVDLPRLAGAAADAESTAKRAGNRLPARRDTPASLSLPRPLRFPLVSAEADGFGELLAEAKIYDDGAVTVVIRGRARVRFEDLSQFSRGEVVHHGAIKIDMDAWAEKLFNDALAFIKPAVIDPVREDRADRESYTAFCLLECDEDPAAFIAAHRDTAASLLVGEESGAALHESQIAEALSRPFSYGPHDYAVFDMDRCILIDPRGDYGDILLIAEHANYRLLELRALDRLLDLRLDEAEKDLTAYGTLKRGRRKLRRGLRGNAPQAKFARIQELRFESLFILENLENSAKIIGDFYLGQIYDQLCKVFNTDGWSRSVERRLDVLSSVYDMAKTDSAERKMLVLEMVFIIVCAIFPAIQIIQVVLMN